MLRPFCRRTPTKNTSYTQYPQWISSIKNRHFGRFFFLFQKFRNGKSNGDYSPTTNRASIHFECGFDSSNLGTYKVFFMFDAQQELEEIRAFKRATKRPRASKLDRYNNEILGLFRAGASLREIQMFLKKSHRFSAHHSTISDWIKRHDKTDIL